jgi:hypothetical protein
MAKVDDVRASLSQYARFITDPTDVPQAVDAAGGPGFGQPLPPTGMPSGPFIDSGYVPKEAPNYGIPDGAQPEAVLSDSDSDLTAVDAEAGFDEENRYPYAPGGQGKPVEAVAGDNFAAIGGEENYNVLSRQGPNMAAQGMQEQAELEGRESAALSNVYGQMSTRANDGAAAILANRMQDQNEMRARDQELKAKTSQYSQSLADTKSFWRSPSGILAGIAAALMELGSDKRGIGIKMLDNAAQADFKTRKDQADSHIDWMKSNLTGYREIAKDREGGDLLAQSEMYRMLALEVEKVAQNFRGPKAQARAKEIIGEYMTRSAAYAGEFTKRNLYVQPQLVDPRIAATMRNQPGYQNFGPTGQSAPGKSAPPSPRGPQGPSQSSVRSGGVASGRPGVVQPGKASQQSIDAMETQKPGSVAIMRNAVNSARDRALYEANGNHVLAKKIFDEKYKHEVEAIGPIAQNKEFQELTANVRGISAFSLKLNKLEALYGKDKMDEVFGAIRSGSMKDADQLISRYGWDANDESKKKRTELLLLKQALQGNINTYIRSISGGAVSDTEAVRLGDVIKQGSTYAEIRKFIDKLGQDSVSKRQAMTANLSPRARHLLNIRVGSGINQNGEVVGPNVPGKTGGK